MSLLAVYPGTFDPITNGHVDILRRALKLFDPVVVALAENVRKEPLFSIAERRAMITDALGADARVEVDAFQGLLVEYVKRRNAGVVIRGLRAIADFDTELQLAHNNQQLAPDIDTVFFMTSLAHSYISSSLVKEIAQFGGDVSSMIPTAAAEALGSQLRGRYRSPDRPRAG